ncbi:hypothetical protein [Oryza sativa Japonica Group]|uniref:Uncharacterized protein n=1 Tax=Oryza sativa subsp. japonica TaxID=39947 RepID=Q8RUC9_ORYSJ|nr:hypothetical protein [Oryza sativa Japonica Group]BAB90439.1 hypothetical protein [Oryza sativa Japonica Group]
MEASPTQDPVGGGGKWRKRRRSSTEPPSGLEGVGDSSKGSKAAVVVEDRR